MPRFFARSEDIGDEHIFLSGQDVNHIKNVLRMSPGDGITVSDGEGYDYYCKVEEISSSEVRLSIVERWKSFSELPLKVYLFQAMPKSDKMDLVVQKAVELGAYRIIPFTSARTVVKPDEKKWERKRERLQSISKSAAMQAGRAIIPEVEGYMSFDKAIACAGELGAAIMPYEKTEGMESSRSVIRSLDGVESLAVFIGPEGGFEESEVLMAQQAGVKTISLGKRILRTETAGMAILSILMFELEKDN